MILNSIRAIRVANRKRYGELIIAADNHNFWRRAIFPHYKAGRKKARDKSELDWHAIFEYLKVIKSELSTVFPYRFIEVEHAEADDVIGTLANNFGSILNGGSEEILIISGDKDYGQLQKFGNVNQYDPVRKKTITIENPEEFLLEHIIKGDVGDGIPNILSADDCLVTGTRQKSMTEGRMIDLKNRIKNGTLNEYERRNYDRNRTLIDLSCIPTTITAEVSKQYDDQKDKRGLNIFDYFREKRLRNLMEKIGDFV